MAGSRRWTRRLGWWRSRRRSESRGVVPAPRHRPGLDRADAAHTRARRARDDVQGPRATLFDCATTSLRQLDLAEADPAHASRHLTFVFVGAGYAGRRGARRDCGSSSRTPCPTTGARGVPRRWVLVDAGPGILGEVPRQLAEHATARLQRDGVEILTSTTLAAVDAQAVTLGDGRRLDTATLVWTAGVTAHPVVRDLGLPLDRRGRIVVDGSLQVRGHPGRLGPRGLRRRAQRGDARAARSTDLPARRAPGTGRGRLTARCDPAVRLSQHRRRRDTWPRPGGRAGLPPPRSRAAGRPGHPRLPPQRGPGSVPAAAGAERRAAVDVLRRDIAELGTLDAQRVS